MSILAIICNIPVILVQRLCAFSYRNRQRHLKCQLNHLNFEVERDSSAETSGVNPSAAIILTLSCLCQPSPRLCCLWNYKPRKSFTSYCLGSCLASSSKQSLEGTHHLFLPLQGPYTSAVAATPGRTDPPSSPHRAPVQCGNGGGWRQGCKLPAGMCALRSWEGEGLGSL